MHYALKGQDCFSCHIRGEKLRQKGGVPEEKHNAFMEQRFKDVRCVRCHLINKPQKTKAFADHNQSHPKILSGSSYCPKCQLVGRNDWKMCPKCGGSLLNMDNLMRESSLHPDQTQCRKCHSMKGLLETVHRKNLGSKFSSEDDCLKCHKGHTECLGCHE